MLYNKKVILLLVGVFFLILATCEKEKIEDFIDSNEEVYSKFSIMYEDRVAQDIYITGLASSVVDAAMMDFNYIKNTYFKKANFLKHNSNELMFVFSPGTIITTSDWDSFFLYFLMIKSLIF